MIKQLPPKKTTTHTPGPWNAFYKNKYNEWHVSVPMPHGTMKLGLFDNGIPSDNPEADARLIAAAPELLEALKEALPWIGGIANENGSAQDAYRAAVLAIAKAEGK
tara:strand:+ start:149 stop:466 length:318 start_codon:yes stop_codon:yes gene_type:complete